MGCVTVGFIAQKDEIYLINFYLELDNVKKIYLRTLVNEPFSNRWWTWLAITGSMLAG